MADKILLCVLYVYRITYLCGQENYMFCSQKPILKFMQIDHALHKMTHHSVRHMHSSGRIFSSISVFESSSRTVACRNGGYLPHQQLHSCQPSWNAGTVPKIWALSRWFLVVSWQGKTAIMPRNLQASQRFHSLR